MICNAIQSICTSEIRRVIRSAAIFCHGEMHFSVASVAWLVGDFYISTVSLFRLVNFEYFMEYKYCTFDIFSEREVGDDERPRKASASTKEPMAPGE